ncbi:MAG: response regulator receiver modulated CheB methylesterase [Herbinix sp.]|jgi:two-component system chemotaxis response regulator CheB|nr:response regulator receiver modulated CheB methylesterase [Herbinix sp.]
MTKNILVIDDSALMRRVLSDIINADDRFRVTEIALNGLEGLTILQNRGKEFDAVLLDINMPKMNGIELLAELKKQNIKATVIVVSTIAKKEASETIRALELGAFDFVTKPESYLEVKSNFFSDRILECLTTATKAIRNVDKETVLEKAERVIKPVTEPSSKKAHSLLSQSGNKLIALACSTGGPKALHTVIPNLPGNLDAGVLIVQHMPGGFTKSLADRLNELSPLTVKEAEDGDILTKGTVFIAKGGYQMRLKKQESGSYVISISKEPARHGLLPCADIMYESLLDTNFDQITCVVLTGMGGDGTAGITQLNKKQNIYVIAQNEETSIVYGMPKVIKDAGLVDEVVALNEVSDAITKNVGVR